MQPWKEFSTKQSFWQAVCLRPPAFLVETSSGAEPTASDARLLTLAIAMLIAVLCSALTEAVSTPAGILALSAYCAAALFVPAALAFVPLALYDCARCVHRADVLRFSGAARPYRDCRMPYARNNAAAFDGIASLLCDRGLRSLGSHEHNARPPAHRLEHAGRTGFPGAFTSQEESQPSRLAR